MERNAPLRDPSTDQSLRRAAVIAGGGLLVMTILSVYAFIVVIKGLVVSGDAPKTASNIAGAEGAFRFAIVCLALVAVLDIIVAWALRVLFAPTSETISTLAAVVRVAYAAVLLVAVGHLIVAAQLLTGPEGHAGFTTVQLQAKGLLEIGTFTAVWNAGLVLFGFYLLLLAYLAIRSSHVPIVIGMLLVPAGLGYLIDSLGLILVHNYTISVAAFTFVGEVVLMLWLLVRGSRINIRAVRTVV